MLLTFDGMDAIREATVEELSAVDGISRRDAEAIWQYYHGEQQKEGNPS